MISPAQMRLLRAWVAAALNVRPPGDPEFLDGSVRWAGTNAALSVYPYAEISVLNPGSNLGGPSEVIPQGTGHGDAQIALRNMEEVVVSVIVASRIPEDDPRLEYEAHALMSRLQSRIWSRALPEAQAMRTGGLAPVRVDAPNNLGRLASSSQWERRCELTVTFHRTQLTIEAPGSIEQVQGAETLSPVSADRPFTVTE